MYSHSFVNLPVVSSTMQSPYCKTLEVPGWVLMEKGAAGEVSVAVEGDESELVVMENLHGGGSAAVIVTVCYGVSFQLI